MSCPECNSIELGDVVEHRMNTNVFGIVIGFSGSLVHIRVSPSLAIMSFHEWELDLVENDELPPPPTATKETAPDNVIQVDFTKGRKLRPDTKTEGAA